MKFTYVYGEKDCGIYLDDQLVDVSRVHRANDVFRILRENGLDITYERVEASHVTDLPKNLSDIPEPIVLSVPVEDNGFITWVKHLFG